MSNDLISRKALLEELVKAEEECEEVMCVPSWATALRVIRSQPTAYDVDGVVEQLTQESIKTLGITETQFAMDKGEYSSYCSLSLYDAIRIMKGSVQHE